jgi:hypothetical protein
MMAPLKLRVLRRQSKEKRTSTAMIEGISSQLLACDAKRDVDDLEISTKITVKKENSNPKAVL